MAFVQIADSSGTVEVVIFPKVYGALTAPLQRDQVIIVKGKLGGRRDPRNDGELKLLADEISLISAQEAADFQPGTKPQRPDAGAAAPKIPLSPAKQRLYIRLEDSANQPLLLTLKETLDDHKGETEVVLITGEQVSKQAIKLPQTISVNEQSLRDLAAIFGSTNVVVK